MDSVFLWLKLVIMINIVDSLEVAIHINESDRIMRRVNEDLSLRCSVTLQITQSSLFKMDWKLPRGAEHISKRVVIKEKDNEVFLKVTDLQEEDSGDYVCTATNRESGSIQKNVTLIVRQRKGCADTHFRCADAGHCIHSRYVCDGHVDCPDSTDEAASRCGADPCEGKIRCSDGRCLAHHLCCDPYLEPNCPTSHQLPCCTRFVHSTYNQVHPSLEQQRRYDSDLGFLQSTIYTVIGCAVAFVFIVTIMVIAVCRVHLKRSAMTPHPRSRAVSSSGDPSASSWNQRHPLDPDVGDLFFGDVNDQFLCSAPTPTPPGTANVLVAYNINSGIQFVGRLIKPPSYSEIVQELAAPDGPPPPYRSQDNLHAATQGIQAPPPLLHHHHHHHHQQTNTESSPSLSRYPIMNYSSTLRPNIIVNRLSDSE